MRFKMAANQTPVPLHLSGNTTEEQNAKLREALRISMEEVYAQAIAKFDLQSARCILENASKMRADLIESAAAILQKHTICERYTDEQVGSNRVYPPSYKIRPIEAQVTELKKSFPGLKNCQEKLARRPLPEHAEGWFAIPRWQALAPTYGQAVEKIVAAILSKRRFQNRIASRLDATYLRQMERSVMAEGILAEQQAGNEILVVAAQLGLRHSGCSARRARARMAGNEFGLGAYAMLSILFTHPERLSSEETLMIDCGGDQYSINGDYTWDRVPLLDYDISGVEFSIFYEDRARDLWGMPSGFLYKME